jgi:hypothetical protein
MTTGVPRVLMVVFQFPPFAGSSAVQRALRFVEHLPAFGWEPLVLSADPRAYEQVSTDLLAELPTDLVVERAFALDAKRHLAWRGRHPAFLAHPDRWRVWQWAAGRAGRRLIARYAPAAIWSTYPIVSAHDIALKLARCSGLPWIADFRDPMVEEDFPEAPALRADFARRELAYAQQAQAFTVTTPSMRDWFAARYPQLGGDNVCLIENGFDEASFAGLPMAPPPLRGGALTLLHSGELYPGIRDPQALFAAARRLRARGLLAADELCFRFRGAGDDGIVLRAAAAHDCSGVVEVLPRVPYREALTEMTAADGLLILQGADCNRQIPAKVYEYLRCGRPILALTEPDGDTGRTLLAAGCRHVAALDDVDAIEAVLGAFVAEMRSGHGSVFPEAAAGASRRARAGELASLLERLRGERR